MYENKTDDELKQIAKDLFGNQIFCDRHCRSAQDVGLVFMPLGLMEPEHRQAMIDEKISFIYEYYSQASPRSCNGMPMFLSANMLNDVDTEKMFGYYNKLVENFENL